MPEARKLNVAIVGKGLISKKVAKDIKESAERVQLYALVTRHIDDISTEFAESNKIPRVLTTEEAQKDANIDIVYIAAPNSEHVRLAKEFMEAGKHVIVEKPLAITEHDVKELIDIAIKNKKFFMEALMYQCHPSTPYLRKLVQENLGKVTHITAKYGSDIYEREKPVQGGAIRNMGCYPISLARYIAGREYLQIINCTGTMDASDERDIDTTMTLDFGDNLKADIQTSSRRKFFEFSITDEEGKTLTAKTNPWMQGKESLFELSDTGLLSFTAEKSLYAYQFDIAASIIGSEEFSLSKERKEGQVVTWVHSLGNARAIQDSFAKVLEKCIKEEHQDEVRAAAIESSSCSAFTQYSMFKTHEQKVDEVFESIDKIIAHP